MVELQIWKVIALWSMHACSQTMQKIFLQTRLTADWKIFFFIQDVSPILSSVCSFPRSFFKLFLGSNPLKQLTTLPAGVILTFVYKAPKT